MKPSELFVFSVVILVALVAAVVLVKMPVPVVAPAPVVEEETPAPSARGVVCVCRGWSDNKEMRYNMVEHDWDAPAAVDTCKQYCVAQKANFADVYNLGQ